MLDHIPQADSGHGMSQFASDNALCHSLVAVFAATLADSIVQMEVDGSFGDPEDLSDFPGSFTFADPEQTFFLTAGQA